MIYLPTENEDHVAQAIVDFPWDTDGKYCPNAVMTAIEALKTDNVSVIRYAMNVMEDSNLPELIEWLEHDSDMSFAEPDETLDMGDGYFADIRDLGYDHFAVVIQNDHWNEQMDICPSAGVHGIGPLCVVNIFINRTELFQWENAEFISVDQQDEFKAKFTAMAEQAVDIYKDMNK